MRKFFLTMLACCLLAAVLGVLVFVVAGIGKSSVNSPLLQSLQGAWVSDADATVAALKDEGQLPLEQIEWTSPLLGKMTMSYEGDIVSMTMTPFDESTASVVATISKAPVVLSSEASRIRGRITVLEEQGASARIEFSYLDAENVPEWLLSKSRIRYRIESDEGGYWLTREGAGGSATSIRERFVRLNATQ